MSSVYWTEYWKNKDFKSDEHRNKQIGRTVHGQVVCDDIWAQTVKFVIEQCDFNKDSEMLELCAGNGMLSIPVAKIIKSVVAIDINNQLLAILNEHALKENIDNITTICDDIINIEFKERFSHVMFYFSLQHFNEKKTLFIFEKIYHALRTNGIFYIGDIPDQRKLWVFAGTTAYENCFFDRLKNDQPAIGQWFDQDFLIKLARYTGFSSAIIIHQPPWQCNSKYRFDMMIKK